MLTKFFSTILIFLLFLSACQSPAQPVDKQSAEKVQEIPAEGNDAPDNEKENTDWQAYRPNELGEVMILMYHEIGSKEGTWSRQVDNFRADLERLYQENYRPVNLNDYISGNINLPAGTTPFVLTFDDGTSGHLRFIEQDDSQYILDPDCAVAIILEMSKKYPDFTPAGTFFIYYPVPFRQSKWIAEKLALLQKWGFEIGNHAYNHENLAKLSSSEVVEALAKNVRATQDYLPGYQVKSLALPYGARAKEEAILRSGKWEETSYQHNAILLVGANPAPSPFAQNFDPYRLPRVRADGTELPRWLDYFQKYPEKRYISDGDNDFITVPRTLEEKINKNKINGKKLRLY
ncbi:MAG: polysaccharide deacetylase family protein [Firmicutes bacterium]|nr:polysaccharide deacetylase family protein [Bacillota bacterium]